MRVFLRSDPSLYQLDQLKEIAEVLQYLGEFLLEEFQYRNEANLGFYIKRTKEPFRALNGCAFPFLNCSGARSHCTEGYGPQKHYYSSKKCYGPRLAMDEYYFGPKKKSEAHPSVFSLLAIVPARSKKNKRCEQGVFLIEERYSIDEATNQPESFVNPPSETFEPSPALSDANIMYDVDVSMYFAD